ncbi:hypothetical protein OQA88_11574 [Cercophora sp. LCS_1]
MSFNEKFQAGESYADEEPEAPYSLDDPVRIAQDLIKELASVKSQISPTDVVAIIQGLAVKPLDDKKGSTEALIGVLTSLNPKSPLRAALTNKLIDTLWDNLQHPPLCYVGGDVKYDVVNPSGEPSIPKTPDTIEFKAPDSDITLREKVPDSPDGIFQYRMPDGSYNNILFPNLGKAGTPYAKSVRSIKRLHGVKPDPGLLFDLLMARDDKHFQENPAGISSMFFYHASIIIHDIFRTSRTDPNKSDTSSYLDLAPLYGSSLKDQLEIRTMKEGKLKPDTFHEKRLLGQPAGVNVMLVLYSRFHNYACDILLKINEGGRFTLSCGPDATPEQRAKAVAKQDHDIFNTARLVTGGLYIEICLHDYLRAITNTHSSKSDWTLDPRVEMDKQFDPEGTPRGVGNQVSVEFNLLYRFHSCISKKDERWINDFFLQLFPGREPEELEQVSWVELGRALQAFEARIPKDPSVRTFSGLERQPDGRFKDADLVRVLQEAMSDPAGIFGARTIPKALKIVEVLGIMQARKWGVASLNEFRDFFGLKRHDTFLDINSDPTIASLLEKLYTDPDMVELYPGLMIENAKPARNTGCGIMPTYSLGRAVLSDAITLVRSDRFNTLDYTPTNLTAWGYNEVQPSSSTLGGSMLYKLIQRGLPGWFPYNHIGVMQPMYTISANTRIATTLGTIDQFTADPPKPPPTPIIFSTSSSAKKILTSPSFSVPWLAPLNALSPGKKDYGWYMLAGDNPANYTHREALDKIVAKIPELIPAIHSFIATTGAQLFERETFNLKKGLDQIDIIRDVAIPLNAQLLADLFTIDIRTDENPSGTLSHTEVYKRLLDIRIWGVNNNDPAQAWNRRKRAQDGVSAIVESTRKLVDKAVLNRGFGLGLLSSLSATGSPVKKGSLRWCGGRLVDELLAKGESVERVVDCMWLNAFGGIGVLVTTFYEVLAFFLREENKEIWREVKGLVERGDDAGLREYVAEAQRLTSSQRNVRVAKAEVEIEGRVIKPGQPVVVLLGEAGRNVTEIPDANEFKPKRRSDAVTPFSYGKHQCFGRAMAAAYIDGLVKLAAKLKDLRPAPGEMGIVKTIRVGTEKAYLNDSWSYLGFDASTWKVHFDGHGPGVFEGERSPTDIMAMQQYYSLIAKQKSEAEAKSS